MAFLGRVACKRKREDAAFTAKNKGDRIHCGLPLTRIPGKPRLFTDNRTEHVDAMTWSYLPRTAAKLRLVEHPVTVSLEARDPSVSPEPMSVQIWTCAMLKIPK